MTAPQFTPAQPSAVPQHAAPETKPNTSSNGNTDNGPALTPDNLVFTEPPEKTHTARGRTSKYSAIAAYLRNDKPGEWAKLPRATQSPAQLAGNIRRGTMTPFKPKGSFEARTGDESDGETGVWVRYVGESGANA